MNNPSPLKLTLSLILVQALFGLHYPAAKTLVQVFPPLVWAAYRCLATFLLLAILCAFQGRLRARSALHFAKPLLVFSLLGITLNQTFFLVGLSQTTASNSALLNTLIPILTLFLAVFRKEERMSRRKAIAFACSLVGVLVILRLESDSLSASSLFGNVFTILNTVCYSFYIVLSKKFVEQHDRLWTTTWTFFYGGIGLLLMAFLQGASFAIPPVTPRLFGLMAYTVLGASVATYWIVNWALAYTEASRVALSVYIQPLLATVVGHFWMGEPLGPRTFIGGFFIFVGVFFATRSEPKVGRLVRS